MAFEHERQILLFRSSRPLRHFFVSLFGHNWQSYGWELRGFKFREGALIAVCRKVAGSHDAGSGHLDLWTKHRPGVMANKDNVVRERAINQVHIYSAPFTGQIQSTVLINIFKPVAGKP